MQKHALEQDTALQQAAMQQPTETSQPQGAENGNI
jgi:hypothetical protein